MFRLSKIFGRDPTFAKPRKFENIIRDLRKFKEPSIIFVNSMTDNFHESFDDLMIKMWLDLFSRNYIHEYIILTKRINRAYNYFKKYPCPKNCWIGTSIENKDSLHRLEKLKKIKTKIRFVSFEPLLEGLGKIDLNGIQWVIVGGESDFKAPRPFDIEWAKEILEQCQANSIPFFYKQSGGKKKIDGCWGSNKIEGRTYLEMPIALTTKESTSGVEMKVSLDKYT